MKGGTEGQKRVLAQSRSPFPRPPHPSKHPFITASGRSPQRMTRLGDFHLGTFGNAKRTRDRRIVRRRIGPRVKADVVLVASLLPMSEHEWVWSSSCRCCILPPLFERHTINHFFKLVSVIQNIRLHLPVKCNCIPQDTHLLVHLSLQSPPTPPFLSLI